jgi:hypothetical protein
MAAAGWLIRAGLRPGYAPGRRFTSGDLNSPGLLPGAYSPIARLDGFVLGAVAAVRRGARRAWRARGPYDAVGQVCAPLIAAAAVRGLRRGPSRLGSAPMVRLGEHSLRLLPVPLHDRAERGHAGLHPPAGGRLPHRPGRRGRVRSTAGTSTPQRNACGTASAAARHPADPPTPAPAPHPYLRSRPPAAGAGPPRRRSRPSRPGRPPGRTGQAAKRDRPTHRLNRLNRPGQARPNRPGRQASQARPANPANPAGPAARRQAGETDRPQTRPGQTWPNRPGRQASRAGPAGPGRPLAGPAASRSETDRPPARPSPAEPARPSPGQARPSPGPGRVGSGPQGRWRRRQRRRRRSND